MYMNEDEIKSKLTPEEYAVLRQKGTEVPFSGKYVDSKEKGMYQCKVCGAQLFSSLTKFDSGTGWPSFDSALPDAIQMRTDSTHGMERTEVVCKKCGSHLGHVFDDGPTDTGKRFCINSVCLDLQKEIES